VRRPPLFALALVSLLILSLARATAQAPAQTLTPYDRGAALAMLKQTKADLKENYYDRSFRGVDVDRLFQQAEDRLKTAASLAQAIGTIADLLMRLDDSHTVFLPPDRKARIRYGWRCQMVGDVPSVVAVDAGSDAARQGLEVGDRLLAWNEYAPTRANLWRIKYVYNYVRPQPTQHLVVRKADGAVKTLDVETRIETREDSELPDLLETLYDLAGGVDDRDAVVGNVLVWRYSGFGDPKNVERVMKKARAARGLILDLRGNGGGSVDTLRALIGWLFVRDVRISVETTRKGETALNAKGRKDAFAGPLAVLVDSTTASSAEIAARLVQIEKRGTVIGDRTAGAVMTARMLPHVYGDDNLTFYATMVTVGDVRLADGSRLEHAGVVPDEIALPTGPDLAAGRDPVLARAVALLGGTMNAQDAGRLFK
jgi:C-terminal processing protease CtpA/Prc